MIALDSDERSPSAPVRSMPPMPPASPRDVRVVTSEALFAGHVEVRIEHHGVAYRLKRTSLGKLILTK